MSNPSGLELAARARGQDPACGVTGDEFRERKGSPEQEAACREAGGHLATFNPP